MGFRLATEYEPAGDQPQAIEQLVNGLHSGLQHQVLLGATGTGKTFTIANVIQRWGRPTLLLAHNKTLAAQLFGEMKKLFGYAAYVLTVTLISAPPLRRPASQKEPCATLKLGGDQL